MTKKLSSFIVACALVFCTASMPFFTRTLPAYASAEALADWEIMQHLYSLLGLFTHDSANYYGGFQGYTDEEKANAMSGLKDFFDGRTQSLRNHLVVGKGIAEAKVNDWFSKLKNGTLDFVSDVGSSVFDWFNAQSGEVAKQWSDGQAPIVDRSKFISGDHISESTLIDYMYSYASRDGKKPQVSKPGDVIAFYILPFAYQYNTLGSDIDKDCDFTFIYVDKYGYVEGQKFEWWPDTEDLSGSYYKQTFGYANKIGFSDWLSKVTGSLVGAITVDDKEQEKYKLPPTSAEIDASKQLPSVIDTYGGNLPQPYKKPENDDKHKPVPFVPTPIPVDWRIFHGQGDGSGGIKIVIKDTDINSIKKFTYNEYKKTQIQLNKLTQTLNNIQNLIQVNTKNNTYIDKDGKEKTLPIIEPDFSQDVDLKKKFPFSLPWDVMCIFKMLNASPEAPAVTIDYPVIKNGSGWGGYTVITKPIEVDFNTDTWNKVAKVCRVMLFLLFAVGICWAFFVK
ncbi:MAG: hypothetical protein PUF16_05805 [Lachnospiraceae bacterium]|nr:hypothetical protein [Lachnospiraceae bacterium]